MRTLRTICIGILLSALCVPSAFAISVTHTKATQSISLYFGGSKVTTEIPADPTTYQILHAYFVEAQKVYPSVYVGAFNDDNSYQRALEMGLINGQVNRNTMTEKELGQFFYRAKVLHKYTPDIRFFHRGLVLFPAEINKDNFPTVKEIDEILGRYATYFKNKSLRPEIKKELEANQSLFIALRKTLTSTVTTQTPTNTTTTVQEKILAVPYHKQESSLSCEIASLHSVLLYYGLKAEDVSEEKLFATLGQAEPTKKTAEGIWGDPDLAFVGSIKGRQIDYSGYGVHWDPIAKLANKYLTGFESFSNKDVPFIVSQLNKGAPVIIWGVTSTKDGKVALSWKTLTGKEINTWNGEHTFIVYGYRGPADNPKEFLIHDPYFGSQTWSSDKLLTMWKVYNYSGVSRMSE